FSFAILWPSLSLDIVVCELGYTLPDTRIVKAIINLEFRLVPEFRLEPVESFLAEFLDIFLYVGLSVFTAIYPLVQELGEKLRVSFVLALILTEPDVQAVVAAAC